MWVKLEGVPPDLRIIGGAWGGRTFDLPRGVDARPTGDRVRESLFAVLRGRVEGACVLDLFAGSGALGLEALSRGAAHGVFCDIDGRAVRAIGETLSRLGAEEGRWEAIVSDFRRALRRFRREGRRFDIALLDPPYAAGYDAEAIGMLADGLVAERGVVVAERSRRIPPAAPPPGWTVSGERRYGDTVLSFICREEKP